MKKIGILYICTGKYDIFWKDFYLSMEKNFLKEFQKEYFVFTDAEKIYDENNNPNIHKIFQENLGWPFNTLMRFEMFKKIEKEIKKMDYIYFLNGNSLVVDEIGKEILPTKEEGIVVVQHPGFFNKKRKKFTYEKNKKSLAYISKNEGDIYICGGFNGGIAADYIELINVLAENIQLDYKKDIIAVWHDESHINKYIINRRYKLLPPSYMYPEDWDLPFEQKIIVRDKEKWGGHTFLRNR